MLPGRNRLLAALLSSLSAILFACSVPITHTIEYPFNNHDAAQWLAATWNPGGTDFKDTTWKPDHIDFADGLLVLWLDTDCCPTECFSKPYAGAEYRNKLRYGRGTYRVRMKAAKGSGLITSFFVFAECQDNPPKPCGTNPQAREDEIDIEILGKDTTEMQVNYFTGGNAGLTGLNMPPVIDLKVALNDPSFDAATDFHEYAFSWQPGSIRWYVDNTLVHTETGTNGPLPSVPGRIIMNLWAQCGTWAGLCSCPNPTKPLAYYDWVSHTHSGLAPDVE
jgi:endo-1,3-1,4-beta-glycanase ExoK